MSDIETILSEDLDNYRLEIFRRPNSTYGWRIYTLVDGRIVHSQVSGGVFPSAFEALKPSLREVARRLRL